MTVGSGVCARSADPTHCCMGARGLAKTNQRAAVALPTAGGELHPALKTLMLIKVPTLEVYSAAELASTRVWL